MQENLGYKRSYLKNKINPIVACLVVIFMLGTGYVSYKFLIPDVLVTGFDQNEYIDNSDFGNKVNISTTTNYQDGKLTVKMTVKNDEKIHVLFNPESIKLTMNDVCYMPQVSQEDKEKIDVEGMSAGDSVSLNLVYNVPQFKDKSSLEILLKGGGQTKWVTKLLEKK